jgi:hypothetical protein
VIRLFENGVEYEIIAEREGEKGRRVGARGMERWENESCKPFDSGNEGESMQPPRCLLSSMTTAFLLSGAGVIAGSATGLGLASAETMVKAVNAVMARAVMDWKCMMICM